MVTRSRRSGSDPIWRGDADSPSNTPGSHSRTGDDSLTAYYFRNSFPATPYLLRSYYLPRCSPGYVLASSSPPGTAPRKEPTFIIVKSYLSVWSVGIGALGIKQFNSCMPQPRHAMRCWMHQGSRSLLIVLQLLRISVGSFKCLQSEISCITRINLP